MFIKEVIPSIISDSRKEKTVKVDIETFAGAFSASAPSGKSIGANETPAYNPQGLGWSFKMLEVLCKQLKNKNFIVRDFSDLQEFEEYIKKFEQRYGMLGANITYALETAFLKAAAKENKKEFWRFIFDSCSKTNGVAMKMPALVGNCIGGGVHSSGFSGLLSKKHPDFQEFLLISDEKSISKAATKNIHAYEYAKKLLKEQENAWLLWTNDENAWKVSMTNEETLRVLKRVAEKYNLRIGLDIAASQFFDKGNYEYKNKAFTRNRKEQEEYIQKLIDHYKLFYVEDSLQEEDFVGFSRIIPIEGGLIVADDLTVTSIDRVKKAIAAKSMNAIIIKPNQNGYLTEVKTIIDLCRRNNVKIIFSHRSGETMDDALADFIKTGITGEERLVKLRRLIEIQKSLLEF